MLRDRMYLLAVRKLKEYDLRYQYMLKMYHTKMADFDKVEQKRCVMYKRICYRIILGINPQYKSEDYTDWKHKDRNGNKEPIPLEYLQKQIHKNC